MNFEEKTAKENYVYNGKILNLKRDDVTLPDGRPAVREIVEHNGGSAILCVKDGKVLLVRQFRYAYKKTVVEIPAGKLNAGEQPDVAAIRELEEEGGIRAERVKKLFGIYPSPGYTNEIVYIYLAEGLKDTETHFDDDEYITAEWRTKEEVKKMMESGEICDAKTLVALLWWINN